MSFLGLDLIGWTAIAAIGGLALAAATTAAIFVAVRIARTDRDRDDAKREQDRQWDSDRRKEDRDRDDQLRREERERDERLRRKDSDEWERRFRAEQRDREDYEARQVTIEVTRGGPQKQSPGHDLNHRIVISAPVTYPIKQADAQIAHHANGGMAIRPTGHAGDQPVMEQGRVQIRMWAEIPDHLFQPAPIVRFVDRHGNLTTSTGSRPGGFPRTPTGSLLQRRSISGSGRARDPMNPAHDRKGHMHPATDQPRTDEQMARSVSARHILHAAPYRAQVRRGD